MRLTRFPHLELALSTIRGRAGGFVGSFVALLCGAAVITACGILLESGLRSGVPAEQYAGASVVVAASQALPVVEDFDLYYSERALLPADLVDDVAAIPGVRSAIPERTFQVKVVDRSGELLPGGLGGDPRPVLGHGWSSAALAPFTLLDGDAPHATDEVVLDAGMAQRAGVGVGDSIAIAVGSTPVTYHVAGVAEPTQGVLS